MSHRLHGALISFRQVHFTSDKWGALDLPHLLASGPIAFRAWFDRELQVNPDAVRALGVVPEAFAVVNFDDQALKVSWNAGLSHQAEAAQVLDPDGEALTDQLTRLTPHVLHAFLRLLQERWPGWTVRHAARSPPPERLGAPPRPELGAGVVGVQDPAAAPAAGERQRPVRAGPSGSLRGRGSSR